MEKVDYKVVTEDLYRELNRARNDPKNLLQDLQKMRTYFKDKEYRNPKLDYVLMTDEGVKAVDDAIDFIRNKIKFVEKLEKDEKLEEAAIELLDHIGPNGYTGHQHDSKSMKSRMKKHLGEPGAMAENISFGWGNARDIILQMVIDDGVSNRGHRKNMFDNTYTKVGIACGYHKGFSHCAVFEFFGKPKKNDLSMKDYKMDDEEWPEGAVSLNKKVSVQSDGKIKTTTLTYTYTLSNGQTVVKTKTFEEDDN
jgi:hypothetical protein